MDKSVFIFLLVLSVFFLNCSKGKTGFTTVKDSINSKNTTSGNPGGSTDKPEKISEELTIKTADGVNLSAVFYYRSESKEITQPGVILIHQFRETKQQWKSEFIDSLLAAGFKVLAYDIRGHGSSGKQKGELNTLLTDPEQAPKDMEAVIGVIKSNKGIDSGRIAAIGTSVGGNLALYAGLNLGVKVPVAVSNGKQTFEAFTGYNELMMGRPYFPKIKNTLLICGSKDGNYEAGQKWILENFLEDPKEMKVYNSAEHGKGLIEAFPEINSNIINWLKKYL